MEKETENSAVMSATFPQDLVERKSLMSDEQFEAEKNFRVSCEIFRIIKEQGLISDKEYRKLNTIIAKKYGAFSYSLLG